MNLYYAPTAAIVILVATERPVRACPYCDSDIGREVAAGIFNDEFARNSLLTLLPILLLLIIVAFIHVGATRLKCIPPWGRKGAALPTTAVAVTLGAEDE